ncbi:MAG: sulfite exporter TauE/SafE family protein [Hyphomonadaceae bacterium]|nr:sulfite exporter TauE/SafE family protein [Hyphomonadaceae bacterium]
MSALAAAIILATTLVTSFISGIFGMAGGIILMAVLVALVSVAMAMIIHGAIQMFANGFRAFLLRDAIDWRVFGLYCIGATAGVAALFFVSWTPDKRALYLLLGLTPMLVWLPKERLHLDIQRREHAVFAGFAVQGLNTLAGVAGPLLDLFFVRADMTRQQIVATKSVTQALSHLIKIGFWSVPVVTAAGWGALPPWWLIAGAIPLSMLGTTLGKRVLERMNDQGFRKWMKGLVTAIGVVLLMRAAGLY